MSAKWIVTLAIWTAFLLFFAIGSNSTVSGYADVIGWEGILFLAGLIWFVTRWLRKPQSLKPNLGGFRRFYFGEPS